MKLLFDENISHRILPLINHLFPDSTQVKLIGFQQRKDWVIWETSLIRGYTIVTHDEDYFELSLLKGTPPKLIWLRTGNITTRDLATLLASRYEKIKEFIESPAESGWGCFELYP